jgi:hypothetical protein
VNQSKQPLHIGIPTKNDDRLTNITREQEQEENNTMQKTFPQNDKINDAIC